ncbi:MAG: hypothetical protein AMXMBFR23_25990 [Chloroflexota bacterium]
MPTARPGAEQSDADRHSDPQSLLDSLLFSVSHDLRSPLLTMSLSADLLDDALREHVATQGESSTVGVALGALRHGTRDLERMLQALTAVSRARRRPLDASPAPLQMILGGHIVLSDEGDLGRRTVAVDVLALREHLDATWGEEPVEIHVRLEGGFAVLSCPEVAPDLDDEPLTALAGSLQIYAGGPVQTLAAAQVILERLGGRVRCGDGHTVFWLPLGGPTRMDTRR